MAGVRDSLGRVGHDLLTQALDSCGTEGFTGELRVAGTPGGTFHLRDGLVVAAESPGAPGPEALLLRTGRVDGEQWAELVREAGGSRWPAAGLVARGCAGAAELRVLCVMALQDAAFAISAGWVDGCERAPAAGPPPAAVAGGEPPARLLQEAARKVTALDALPCPVRPDRERPLPGAVPPGRRLSSLQQELLLHADGRRTTRDLAFRTGRGVYTVTVETARMLGEGFLECADGDSLVPLRLPAADRPVHHLRPRTAPLPDLNRDLNTVPIPDVNTARAPHLNTAPTPLPPLTPLPLAIPLQAPPPPAAEDTAVRHPPPPPPRPSAPPEPAAVSLPRRTPGASGITEALTPQQNGASWKGFLRLWTADRRVPKQPEHRDQQMES
ncbi:MarR family transcriptional regulator [Streptomyces sp. NPDC058739]|uniref:MarR family transcriptional regulator n=1 Tax=Streptomyces sp. NPDC058739 TaxID=3346618 RepID=UPI0036836D0C